MTCEDLLILLRTRRSIRQFQDQPVPRAVLEKLFEAARWAPSNHNRQGWRFIVLQDRRVISTLAEEVERELSTRLKALPEIASTYTAQFLQQAVFFKAAPVLVVALHKLPLAMTAALLSHVEQAALVSGEPLSTAMAVENLVLAASALELGACILTAPLIAKETLKIKLQIGPAFDITCLIALGYPAESPPAPPRKHLAQVVEFR